jgi:hypothetical protein
MGHNANLGLPLRRVSSLLVHIKYTGVQAITQTH